MSSLWPPNLSPIPSRICEFEQQRLHNMLALFGDIFAGPTDLLAALWLWLVVGDDHAPDDASSASASTPSVLGPVPPSSSGSRSDRCAPPSPSPFRPTVPVVKFKHFSGEGFFERCKTQPYRHSRYWGDVPTFLNREVEAANGNRRVWKYGSTRWEMDPDFVRRPASADGARNAAPRSPPALAGPLPSLLDDADLDDDAPSVAAPPSSPRPPPPTPAPAPAPAPTVLPFPEFFSALTPPAPSPVFTPAPMLLFDVNLPALASFTNPAPIDIFLSEGLIFAGPPTIGPAVPAPSQQAIVEMPSSDLSFPAPAATPVLAPADPMELDLVASSPACEPTVVGAGLPVAPQEVPP